MKTPLVKLLLTRIGDYPVALRALGVASIGGGDAAGDPMSLPALFRVATGADNRIIHLAGSSSAVVLGGDVRIGQVSEHAVQVVPRFLSLVAKRSGIEALVVVSETEVAFLVDPLSIPDDPNNNSSAGERIS